MDLWAEQDHSFHPCMVSQGWCISGFGRFSTLPLHCHYITITLPLRYHYINRFEVQHDELYHVPCPGEAAWELPRGGQAEFTDVPWAAW